MFENEAIAFICNETKHRLMSAKWNLINLFESKNTGLFDRTYITKNNFSSLNLPFFAIGLPYEDFLFSNY